MDLISRQQVIDALAELQGRASTKAELKGISKAWKRIKQLPSAEPKIIHCEDCKYGMLDPSFPYQWFCKYKGDEWNNSDYFCGHARKREVAE